MGPGAGGHLSRRALCWWFSPADNHAAALLFALGRTSAASFPRRRSYRLIPSLLCAFLPLTRSAIFCCAAPLSQSRIAAGPAIPLGHTIAPCIGCFPIQGAFRLWTIVHWTGSLVGTWRGVLLHPLIGRWHRSWTAPWQRDRPPRTRPRTGLASRRQGSSPPGRDSAVQRSPGTAGSLW